MSQLLYLAPVAWHDLWQRPQRLAQALAAEYELTYCNPVGMRSIRWNDCRRMVPRTSAPSAATVARILRPRYLPWQWAPLDAVNRRWLVAQVRSAHPEFVGGDFTLWIGAPSLLAAALLESLRPSRVVYDCMDHFAGFQTGRARQRIEAAENAIVARADVIFVTSHPLWDQFRHCHRHVLLAPNGVDVDHFSSVATRIGESKQAMAPAPVIGFQGALGDWLDYELIESLAAARPNWRWEFVGPIHAKEARRICSLPNVQHIPAVAYRDLPEQLTRFNVGVIPFRRNRLTDAAQPVKLGEYLAAGLPVVATRLASLHAVPGHVTLAETAADWLAALEAALADGMHSLPAIAERRMLAATHSWRRTAETVLAALRELRDTPQRHVIDAARNQYRPAA